MRVSIKGVVIGGIVDVVTSSLLGIPFVIYAMLRIDVSHTPSSQVSTAVIKFIHASPALFAGELFVGLMCSVLGGYVAAWLAKRDELLNGVLSSFLCETMGVYAVMTGRDSNPHWLQFLLFVASPLAAALGGDLMRRVRRGKLQPV
jgi:cell shape-determining protein MreD